MEDENNNEDVVEVYLNDQMQILNLVRKLGEVVEILMGRIEDLEKWQQESRQ